MNYQSLIIGLLVGFVAGFLVGGFLVAHAKSIFGDDDGKKDL